MKWRTCVNASSKQRLLVRGTLFSGVGIFMLTLASVFLPLSSLSYWGFPLFVMSMGLIAWGMIPYCRLIRQERNPDELVLTDDEKLIYYRNGNKIGLIPLSLIDKIHYVHTQQYEGISLEFHQQRSEKIVVFQKKQLFLLDGNVFLPFFSERTYNELVPSMIQKSDLD